MILASSVIFKSPNMSRYRTPQTKKESDKIEPTTAIKKEHQKAAVLCLLSAFQGVEKRIKGQIITKLIVHSGKKDRKNNKIKFIALFSNAFFKRKTQWAFDKLLRSKMKSQIMEKAVTNLALKYRRLRKLKLSSSLDKMRVNKS